MHPFRQDILKKRVPPHGTTASQRSSHVDTEKVKDCLELDMCIQRCAIWGSSIKSKIPTLARLPANYNSLEEDEMWYNFEAPSLNELTACLPANGSFELAYPTDIYPNMVFEISKQDVY